MKNKYEIGQEFILNEGYSFYTDAENLVDIPKGSIFIVNDVMEGSDCENSCDNCGVDMCTGQFLVVFDTFDTEEIRLTKIQLNELNITIK